MPGCSDSNANVGNGKACWMRTSASLGPIWPGELGVTRARVTRILRLLDLAPEVLEAVVGLGDPLSDPVVTERSLRPLLRLSAEEQGCALASIAFSQRNR